MPMFRKKPVVIEARQFETNNVGGDEHMDSLVEWIRTGGGRSSHDSTDIFIVTLEGKMAATVGDWIIRGVQGEHYPCKPDIFEATYEPLPPEHPAWDLNVEWVVDSEGVHVCSECWDEEMRDKWPRVTPEETAEEAEGEPWASCESCDRPYFKPAPAPRAQEENTRG